MTDLIPLISSMLGSILVILLPLVLLIVCARAFLAPTGSKGERGERFVSKQILGKLDPLLYSIHDDVYLPRPDGKGTTQIDHVVVSPYGIFVIETKNLKGWIFGDEKSRQWTQVLYRKKYRFQNPIHQNQLHVNALRNHLSVQPEKIKNVVFFVGDTTFKTSPPPFVLNSGFRSYIESHQAQLLSAEECDRIRKDIIKLDPGEERGRVAKEHIAGIQKRVGNEATTKSKSQSHRKAAQTPPPLPAQKKGASNQLEEAKAKTFELVGRNLMLLQHLEQMLKRLLPIASFDGEDAEMIRSRIEKKRAAVELQTLGHLVNRHIEEVLTVEEQSVTPDRPGIHCSMQVVHDSEQRKQESSDRLLELVDSRNRLVHHLLSEISTDHPESWLETHEFLKGLSDKTRAEIKRLNEMAKAHDSMRQLLKQREIREELARPSAREVN